MGNPHFTYLKKGTLFLTTANRIYHLEFLDFFKYHVVHMYHFVDGKAGSEK